MAYQPFNFGKRLGLVGEIRENGGEPISGARQVPVLGLDPCPIGSYHMYVGTRDIGMGQTQDLYDCISTAGSGGHGGGIGVGPYLGPFVGDKGSSGGSSGRKETEEEKNRREGIEDLMEKLNFITCANPGTGPEAGGEGSHDKDCCTEAQKKKMAEALYDLLNSSKVKEFPGLADCLLGEAHSMTIRCNPEQAPKYSLSDLRDFSSFFVRRCITRSEPY